MPRAHPHRPAAAAEPTIVPAFKKRAEDDLCPVACGDSCCRDGYTCYFDSNKRPVCQNSAISGFNDFLSDLDSVPTPSFDALEALSSARPSLDPSVYSSFLTSLQDNPTSQPDAAAFQSSLAAVATVTPSVGPSKGAIAGGVIGALVAIGAAGVGVWMFLRKKRRRELGGGMAGRQHLDGGPVPGQGYQGYRAGSGDVKANYVQQTVRGGVELESRERPLPAPPPAAWEMGDGRRSVVEMEGDMAFGLQRRNSAVAAHQQDQVWHEMDASSEVKRWN